MSLQEYKCFLCGSNNQKLIIEIREKPDGEIDLRNSMVDYYREIRHCHKCGVYNNYHAFDIDDIYHGEYNRTMYDNHLYEEFNRIMNLPEGRSDNNGRVKRVLEYLKQRGMDSMNSWALDVGSGLCVFLAEMKKWGFKTYCVDPDPRAANHAQLHARVDKAYTDDFASFSIDDKFDLITFNKVLEHVKDPVKLLSRAHCFLGKQGFVYVELPEGDYAIQDGGVVNREEFWAGHYTIFTLPALDHLASRAGFKVDQADYIHEPSGKHTIYAFLIPD